ncbi:hypothetical protein BJF93_12265 [Xaviernesmea oryzae]|uniref:DUF3329 domain-containing protein n=1 Tax=Xaviernesmea oryzae TaxID=464029 RepID=A0A1Q9AVI6_9HYPH|nr:hypothetical protein [Xaviernesmea oryzae]OLP59472.1 hypothetical protein BJF93_12265 [Xaviernesmea oryzae]SEL58687.1 hypothetical protein SAMN04487976_11016 [Xaviernesmea oryzae]
MIKLIDPDHPFYRPLWRRLLIVGACFAWTGVEFWNGEQTWGTIFLIISAYVVGALILFFKPKTPDAPFAGIEPAVPSEAAAPDEVGRDDKRP